MYVWNSVWHHLKRQIFEGELMAMKYPFEIKFLLGNSGMDLMNVELKTTLKIRPKHQYNR